MAKRFDVMRMDKMSVTPQGYIRADAYATRAGVFSYQYADGTVIRELRHPDDVFSEDSLKSLQQIPMTDDHPEYALDSKNTKDFQIGFTGEKVKISENEFVQVGVTITDSEAIQKIMDKEKEQLSCGYDCEVVMEQGIYEPTGELYDCRQKKIVYNHVALVKYGRAGDQVKLKLDSKDAVLLENQKTTMPPEKKSVQSKVDKKGEVKMFKITLDGKEFEVSKDVYDAFMAEKVKMDEASKEKDSEIEVIKGKADSLEKISQEQAKKIEETKLTDSELLKRADSVLKIKEFAKKVLGKDEIHFDSVLDIKKQVLTHVHGEEFVKDKSDDFISGAFSTVEGIREDQVKVISDSLKKIDSNEQKEKADAPEYKTAAQIRDEMISK